MPDGRSKIPVSAYHGGIGVICAENRIADLGFPDTAGIGFPFRQRLGAGDHGTKRFCRAVDNAPVRRSRVGGIHILPVNTGRDKHFVPRLRDLRCVADVAEGKLKRTVPVPGGIDIDIVDQA